MTPGLPLNTAAAHTWAAVVSGTAWKRHTLGCDGLPTAEYVRGPVVVWASRPGEGKALAPAGPSALEVQIDRVNTAQVFERFYWAARGKVRPSVRWKTGRQPRRRVKLETLADLKHAGRMEDRRAVGKRGGLIFSIAPNTRRAKREARKFCEAERYEDRLRDLAPADPGDSSNGIDSDVIEWLNFYDRGFQEQLRWQGRRFSRITVPKSRFAQPVIPDSRMAAYFALTGRWESLGVLLNHWKFRRPTLGHLLKDLQAAEYRAHLTRRVKPAPRRHRIRRPLYARPRPPAAPLAPPVS